MNDSFTKKPQCKFILNRIAQFPLLFVFKCICSLKVKDIIMFPASDTLIGTMPKAFDDALIKGFGSFLRKQIDEKCCQIQSTRIIILTCRGINTLD
jgi:hypothetical protein